MDQVKQDGFALSSTNNNSFDNSARRGRMSGPTRKSTKGKWTAEEDKILTDAVRRFKGKNWKTIAQNIPGRTDVQCLHRWQKVLDPELVKGPWTAEEDSLIIKLVSEQGTKKKWSKIAQSLPGRIGKQCRERWCNHLNPSISKVPWTIAEEAVLLQVHNKYGNRWAEIAKFLPGRTENAIKNHWNCSMKRKLALNAGSSELPSESNKTEEDKEIIANQNLVTEEEEESYSLELSLGINYGRDSPLQSNSCVLLREGRNASTEPQYGTTYDKSSVASLEKSTTDVEDSTTNMKASNIVINHQPSVNPSQNSSVTSHKVSRFVVERTDSHHEQLYPLSVNESTRSCDPLRDEKNQLNDSSVFEDTGRISSTGSELQAVFSPTSVSSALKQPEGLFSSGSCFISVLKNASKTFEMPSIFRRQNEKAGSTDNSTQLPCSRQLDRDEVSSLTKNLFASPRKYPRVESSSAETSVENHPRVESSSAETIIENHLKSAIANAKAEINQHSIGRCA